jgi:hypothetical protein
MPTDTAAGLGEKFNPMNILGQVSSYINTGNNRILFVMLCCIIGLVGLFLLYKVWEEWCNIPPRERSFRVGKTNIIQVFLEELKTRLKKKKTRF